ncbi:hypothetical protein N7532_003610 [Penicillium argentinense]|uniref:Extracellular membrane protein CFEM domain-containing protein n=1 Tax=Penicillium argentinense TaxID=1131581 RepID=A0A9W9KEP6_9EURO|nr:uncharacterized protein N7532_003610 [Penicillium argentinense]KAJ5103081.1 hypothetical protein N7532_003610 [Penicillium argentinense]
MRFLPITLFGLALAPFAAAEFKTWDDVVGDMPKCIDTCMDKFYTSAGLEDACGSSDSASVSCLCGVKNSFSEVQDGADDLSSCISSTCDMSELSQASSKLSEFTERFQDLQTQCESEENAASSLAPGLNTLLVSGAALLLGAVL